MRKIIVFIIFLVLPIHCTQNYAPPGDVAVSDASKFSMLYKMLHAWTNLVKDTKRVLGKVCKVKTAPGVLGQSNHILKEAEHRCLLTFRHVKNIVTCIDARTKKEVASVAKRVNVLTGYKTRMLKISKN